jgi:hypothetical protein
MWQQSRRFAVTLRAGTVRTRACQLPECTSVPHTDHQGARSHHSRRAAATLSAATSTMGNVPLQIRKLSQDEAAKAFPRSGQMDLSEYVEAVSSLQPGDTAAMDVGDLTGRAAKRRLGQAAAQLGRRLRWARGTDTDVVYFQLLAGATPRNQGFTRPSGSGKTRRLGPRRPRSSAASGAPVPDETPVAL